jgi:outer membrane protein assembly factor BamD
MFFRWYIVLIVALLSFSACSEYNKVIKSPDPEYKYQKAVEYYEEEEYDKALPLLEELIPLFKGTDKGRKIFYYYCYANYHQGYTYLAAAYFKRYAETYPNSEYAEDALFMSAFCNYLESPIPSLDQSPTYMALDELQLFVNTYPQSSLVDSANHLVDVLHKKLEVKKFENSKQYYKIRKYKSAIVALNQFLQEYPDSPFSEEAKMTMIKSHYYLAINSIDEKKDERFVEGIETYRDFIDNFADGKYHEEAELYYDRLLREREKFLEENPIEDEL